MARFWAAIFCLAVLPGWTDTRGIVRVEAASPGAPYDFLVHVRNIPDIKYNPLVREDRNRMALHLVRGECPGGRVVGENIVNTEIYGITSSLPDYVVLVSCARHRWRPHRMTVTITAFERSPDGGKGLARDMRVRWALEEVGQPYQVRLVSFRAMKEPAHRALHPFGQIPTYEEGDLVLFETGAIVFHIAERHAGLLPEDANARARAITWMFAALNTVEPAILELATARLLEGDKPWYKERLPLVQDRVRDRLSQLSVRLGDADWLDGAFSTGDLMMVSVLLRLKSSGILDEYPNLAAYVVRGEARPAYKRAFDAQLAIYTGKRSTG